MPTASGKPTADEKREADRLARIEARKALTVALLDPEWVQSEAEAYVGRKADHEAKQASGEIRSFDRFDGVWYPAVAEHSVKVGRRTFTFYEGQVRSLAVQDALDGLGIRTSNRMSVGIAQGTNGLRYGYQEY